MKGAHRMWIAGWFAAVCVCIAVISTSGCKDTETEPVEPTQPTQPAPPATQPAPTEPEAEGGPTTRAQSVGDLVEWIRPLFEEK